MEWYCLEGYSTFSIWTYFHLIDGMVPWRNLIFWSTIIKNNELEIKLLRKDNLNVPKIK